MRALGIAIGNPLRRDDGAAHHVPMPAGFERRSLIQLSPEVAEEIALFDLVVFLDASATATEPGVEPVAEPARPTSGSPFTHVCSPSEIVALARRLFGFSGRAYLCHIPAQDFSTGEKLSARATRFAQEAAAEIEHIAAKIEHIIGA